MTLFLGFLIVVGLGFGVIAWTRARQERREHARFMQRFSRVTGLAHEAVGEDREAA